MNWHETRLVFESFEHSSNVHRVVTGGRRESDDRWLSMADEALQQPPPPTPPRAPPFPSQKTNFWRRSGGLANLLCIMIAAKRDTPSSTEAYRTMALCSDHRQARRAYSEKSPAARRARQGCRCHRPVHQGDLAEQAAE